MITNEQIKAVTHIIVEEIQPEKVLLFGSYAGGVPNNNSDIDIIMVLDKELEKKNRMENVVMLNIKTALPDLMFPKDFKLYSLNEYRKLKENKFSFLGSALQNAKMLYERQ